MPPPRSVGRHHADRHLRTALARRSPPRPEREAAVGAHVVRDGHRERIDEDAVPVSAIRRQVVAREVAGIVAVRDTPARRLAEDRPHRRSPKADPRTGAAGDALEHRSPSSKSSITASGATGAYDRARAAACRGTLLHFDQVQRRVTAAERGEAHHQQREQPNDDVLHQTGARTRTEIRLAPETPANQVGRDAGRGRRLQTRMAPDSRLTPRMTRIQDAERVMGRRNA